MRLFVPVEIGDCPVRIRPVTSYGALNLYKKEKRTMKRLNNSVYIFIALIFAWFVLPLQTQSLAAEPERIPLEEFKNMFDSEADMVIVDTRDISSYLEGHIPGAISMRYPDEIRARNQELPRDKTIILYCS